MVKKQIFKILILINLKFLKINTNYSKYDMKTFNCFLNRIYSKEYTVIFLTTLTVLPTFGVGYFYSLILIEAISKVK